jgi:ParB/RepB/Spo0J family partition protein
MPKPKADSRYRELALELIDEPSLAMRETFEAEQMEDLAASIRDLGVIMPIVVKPAGGRYEICDGHRRYLAAIRAGLATIPAVLQQANGTSGEAIKIHANAFREDVNPAEEARYLDQVLERDCAGDIDQLCALTHLARSYVEGRLLLLEGDPDVFTAIRERKISLAVARELNRVKDRGYRLMYLDAAIRGGATARLVAEWRIKSDSIMPADAPDSGNGANQYTGLPAPVTSMTCLCCDSDEEPWEMELLPLHRRCRRIFLDRPLAAIKANIGQGPNLGTHAAKSDSRTS